MSEADSEDGGLGLRITQDMPSQGFHGNGALLWVSGAVAKEEAVKH